MEKSVTNSNRKYIIFGVVGISLCLISFLGGIQFQKMKSSTTKNNNQSLQDGRFSQGRSGGRIMNGGFGTVTVVDAGSITVNDARQNKTTTYTINSSTSVQNNGAPSSIGDIKVGDRVVVTPDTNDSKIASRIIVGNPGMSGGRNGGDGSTQTN